MICSICYAQHHETGYSNAIAEKKDRGDLEDEWLEAHQHFYSVIMTFVVQYIHFNHYKQSKP